MDRISSVLVVEDNESTLEALRLLLTKGLTVKKVRTTRHAEDALAILPQERFDLILSDYQLEGMDGAELLETLRRRGDQTPFILITGVADKACVLRVMGQAKVDILGKPFRVSDLTDIMDRLLAA